MRPTGVTVIAVLFALGAASQVIFAILNAGYLPVGLFFLGVGSYLAIGLYRGWNHARVIAIVVLALMLAMVVLNLGGILFLSEAQSVVPAAEHLPFILKNLVRLIVLPLVLIYLFRSRVREYFRQSASSSSGQLRSEDPPP